MKKTISIFTAALFLVASFSISNINNSFGQRTLSLDKLDGSSDPDYDQGGHVEDDNGVCVYVCPHSIAESYCVS